MDQKALIEACKAAEKALLEAQRTDHLYGVREGAPPIAPWPAKPCKLVFLDLDGVLNCEQSIARFGTPYRFWPPSIEALNHVLRETGALVVITSSWRQHWTLREIAEVLEKEGLSKTRVVGKTAVSDKERGLEINFWLRSVPYPLASFVIIDDREDMAMHRSRLIRTSGRTGLGMPEAMSAIELLAHGGCHMEG